MLEPMTKYPVVSVGARYGRWTVIAQATTRRMLNGKTKFMWEVNCDCGNRGVVPGINLKRNESLSCGCLHRDRAGVETHGASKRGAAHPEYRVWIGIRSRCGNPNAVGYANYGGRGIVVCERWQQYQSFIADMGQRPSKKHSIERKNVNKGYEPDNCYWATKKQQVRNTRRSRHIEFNGRTMILKDWADELGLTFMALYKRINKGWPLELALASRSAQKL